jgi:uncharacterized membrane protein (UPF0127 family)
MVVRTIAPMATRLPALALALATSVLSFATGCGSGSPGTAQVHLEGRPVTVLLADQDGMRGRTFEGADAMLFSWPEEQDPTAVRFVMDGVAMPLDVAYFDGAGRWLGTTQMEPCDAAPCPRYAAPGPFRWALEAPAGAFLMGLSADARLEVDGG